MEGDTGNMIDFTDPSLPQCQVLAQALAVSDYDTISNATLAILSASEDVPDIVKAHIRTKAFAMAMLNNGNPDAPSILHIIANTTWSTIGIADDAIPALTWEQRTGIIDVVMGVSKSIIAGEAVRLESLAELDTALPEPVEPE